MKCIPKCFILLGVQLFPCRLLNHCGLDILLYISSTLVLLLFPDVLFSAVNSVTRFVLLQKTCKNETRRQETLKHRHIRC